MNIRDYPTNIHTRMQTTYPQPKKRNSPRCSHSHTLYNFPTHNRHGQNGISTASQEYLNIPFLWTTKNTQAKLSSPICFRMWWSNWPSFILSCPFYTASSQQLSLTHKKHKTLPQPYRKTLTLPNQCIFSNSWCLVPLHKNPHNDGVRTVKHFMEEYKHLLPIDCSPPPTVLAILNFIHKHNTFNFMVILTTIKSLAPSWRQGWLSLWRSFHG